MGLVTEPFDVLNIQPGTLLLDKYRVIETVGVGGMGVVLSVQHINLGTRMAIKLLLPQLMSNEALVKRFLREARAATRIQGEHVARVLDVDTLPDGLPYMVMEYLEGWDLARHIAEGRRFTIPEAIECIRQAAEALAQAHEVGIIHRDIKPANLFLIESGSKALVKVLDFGISKMVEDGDDAGAVGLTKTTTVLGSGLYMSPEQMRSAKNVDHRTDIYALAVCLYELLTHSHPYDADSFGELCIRVSTEEPEPIRKHRPDVSEALAQVIAKGYAREPHDRYETVAEFAAALAPHASAEASTPPPTQPAAQSAAPSVPPVEPIATVESVRPAPAPAVELPVWLASDATLVSGSGADQVVTAALQPAEPPASRAPLFVLGAIVLLAAIMATFLLWPEVTDRDGGESASPSGPDSGLEAGATGDAGPH